MLYIIIAAVFVVLAVIYLKKEQVNLQQYQNNAVSAYNQLEIHKKLRAAKENYSLERNKSCYDNMVLLSTRIYNETAGFYNKKCTRLPTCLAAAILGFRPLNLIGESECEVCHKAEHSFVS